MKKKKARFFLEIHPKSEFDEPSEYVFEGETYAEYQMCVYSIRVRKVIRWIPVRIPILFNIYDHEEERTCVHQRKRLMTHAWIHSRCGSFQYGKSAFHVNLRRQPWVKTEDAAT